jgi:hypothetical protein
MWGTLRATATLVLLFAIASVLVAAIIAAPLVASGRPAMPGAAFGSALAYFAAIGLGFMFVQIALLQRFSVFLGHPAYTFTVTLFAMILFAGMGSYLSEPIARRVPRAAIVLPLLAAAVIAAAAVTLGWITHAAVGGSLAVRIAVVIACLAPIATVMGFFFPAGLRAVSSLSGNAAAWMWGINGACGVLGSIAAVGISLWIGIQANLFLAALLYASLAVTLTHLERSASRRGQRVPV